MRKDPLLGIGGEDYGSDYRRHIIEIYKLYISGIENISNRRQTNNSFFLTMNTAVIGIAGYLGLKSDSTPLVYYIPIASAAGIILCYLWHRLLKSYQQLNEAKFAVLHDIERMLPICVYDREWDILGYGKDKSKYIPFSRIEGLVPFVFLALHFIILVLSWLVFT